MKEHTLVLVKPDGVIRGLIGEVITRFEKAGLKIVAMKMIQPTKTIGLAHYTEDLAARRGQKVRDMMVDFLQTGPVVAMVVEGIHAIEVVRKLIGSTEPTKALPGTIRGDFSHHSFKHSDTTGVAVKNIIHASSDEADAKREVSVWFKPSELVKYKTVHESETF